MLKCQIVCVDTYPDLDKKTFSKKLTAKIQRDIIVKRLSKRWVQNSTEGM